MWFPEEDRHIYVDNDGGKHDPLALRQSLVLSSGGLIWALLGRRRELFFKLADNLPTGEEATAEVELANTEQQISTAARKAWDLPDERTEDEVLDDVDHFVRWLIVKKKNTAA